MLASYNWLRELSGIDATPAEYGEKLTTAGLELEAVHEFGSGLDGVVIAEVRGKRKHPERDKLSLVTVYDGEEEQEVVCGAPNVPDAGGRVLFARLGAELPGGFAISPRKIGGIVSSGRSDAERPVVCAVGEYVHGVKATAACNSRVWMLAPLRNHGRASITCAPHPHLLGRRCRNQDLHQEEPHAGRVRPLFWQAGSVKQNRTRRTHTHGV